MDLLSGKGSALSISKSEMLHTNRTRVLNTLFPDAEESKLQAAYQSVMRDYPHPTIETVRDFIAEKGSVFAFPESKNALTLFWILSFLDTESVSKLRWGRWLVHTGERALQNSWQQSARISSVAFFTRMIVAEYVVRWGILPSATERIAWVSLPVRETPALIVGNTESAVAQALQPAVSERSFVLRTQEHDEYRWVVPTRVASILTPTSSLSCTGIAKKPPLPQSSASTQKNRSRSTWHRKILADRKRQNLIRALQTKFEAFPDYQATLLEVFCDNHIMMQDAIRALTTYNQQFPDNPVPASRSGLIALLGVGRSVHRLRLIQALKTLLWTKK